MTSFHNDEINALISACLSGNATQDEAGQLEKWVETSEANRRYYQEIKNLWDLSNKEFQASEISVQSAYSAFQRNIRRRIRRTMIINIFQRAAAILILPLLAFAFWLSVFRPNGENHRNNVYCEVSAAFGTRSVITLSDSSRIWLNSGSTLKYPQHFTGNTREVFLYGEAYFEVDADPKKPFIVNAGGLKVRATGTRFNVNASGVDNYISVTLVSGQVSVSKTTGDRQSIDLARMVPDNYLTYDTTSGEVSMVKEDTYRHIAWKDGKLIFRNDPLENVLKKIGYFYNVDMVITDAKLREYRYRATFEEESIEEIMNLLKLSSPLDFRVEERNPLPDGSFPKKKIIIFPVNR